MNLHFFCTFRFILNSIAFSETPKGNYCLRKWQNTGSGIQVSFGQACNATDVNCGMLLRAEINAGLSAIAWDHDDSTKKIYKCMRLRHELRDIG